MKRTLLAMGMTMMSILLLGCAHISTASTSTPTTTTSTTTTTTDTFTTTTTTTGQIGVNHPFSLTVGSGTGSVTPFLVFISSYESYPGMGTFYADGPGAFGYDLMDYVGEFPSLTVNGAVTVVHDDYTEWYSPRLYAQDGTLLEDTTLEALASLAEGTYYLRIYTSQTEGDFYRYNYGFVTLLVE